MTRPETYTLDITGDNGTPFRFVYELGGTIRYYDRRYPTQPGEPHYHPRNYNENGQNCGPDMLIESFTETDSASGIRPWHDVEAWAIDPGTQVLVGNWLRMLKGRDPR